MITRALMMRLFDGFTITRWNDKKRPFDFIEIDKQTHKMMYAYFFGIILEKYNKDVEWDILINCCVYEYIERLVLTDLKSPFYHYIRNEKDTYNKLINWIEKDITPYLKGCQKVSVFQEDMRDYLNNEKHEKYRALLKLSNTMATLWEFNHIYKNNLNGYKIKQINDMLTYEKIQHFKNASEKWNYTDGLHVIYKTYNINKLINILAELRYQNRWSHLPMYPKTSVLGHMGFVALLTYFITREISIRNNYYVDNNDTGIKNAYINRLYNNFYTGLFHDIKEVATRDIISPVKKALSGINDSIIQEYETQEFADIQKLIVNKDDSVNEPYTCIKLNKLDKLINEDEFSNLNNYNIIKNSDGYISKDDIKLVETDDKGTINLLVNNPRDGKLVKVADNLSACIEAKSTILHGINNPILTHNYNNIMVIYSDENNTMYGYNINALFKQLE